MKLNVSLILLFFSINSFALPAVNITPNVVPNKMAAGTQSTVTFDLKYGQRGTYIYQLANNTKYTLSGVGLNPAKTPVNISLVSQAQASLSCNDPAFTCQYCADFLTLAPGERCLIKIAINGIALNQSVIDGPTICTPANKSAYCNVPVSKPLNTKTTPTSANCLDNIDNFNSELAVSFDTTPNNPAWGPSRNHLVMPTTLSSCPTSNPGDVVEVNWMQNRVIAAEDFWVRQKINYCHHHVPDYRTTPALRSVSSGGGYCSAALDIHPNTPYFNQPVRWNYSGIGSETRDNWINNELMWYGVDCSDFTSFIYNFAFGIQFNSDTGYQAGQARDGSQDNLTPNAQTAMNRLQPFDNNDPDSPAGVLVCKNGNTEVEDPDCGGLGTNGYFSVFVPPYIHPQHPEPTPSNITDEDLKNLKPGDLIFLGFAGGSGNNPTSMVTHVITWTGKHVGRGPNDIPPEQIAPESICPNDWQPVPGNGQNEWVIIDSHYQGPDYRILTSCFYKNNIWGVKRVIGYMTPKF